MQLTLGPWEFSCSRRWPDACQLSHRYDAAAATWHQRIARVGYLDGCRHLFGRLVDEGVFAALPSPAAILDCGVGTAACSLALVGALAAQHSAPQVILHGLDLSWGMLSHAKRQLLERGHITPSAVRLICSNALALPYPAASFDVVVSGHMLEHLPDPRQGLDELVRVMRPGALLILISTQPSLLGRALELRWGNGCLAVPAMLDWLAAAGLAGATQTYFPKGTVRWASRVYVGWKPPASLQG